jgi:hypothetical protein
MSIHVSRDNPYRPADWRWQRAIGVIEETQPRPGRKQDGHQGHAWIKKAIRFKLAYDEAGEDPLAQRRLLDRMPAVYWAHYAYQNEHQQMRWDIESQILARCTDHEIAFSCGVAPEVVDAYENLFFNVRDKLHHKRYITHCVLGHSIQRGLSEREYDLLWKLYGYFYGPHVLEVLVTKMVNPVWCTTPDTVNSTLQDDAIASMKFKAALAAKTIPVNNNTQVDLLHVFTKFVEVERTTDSVGKAQNQILDHIEAMMVTLPFNVGGRDPRTAELVPQTNTAKFRQTNVELSFHETMAVAAGQQLPHADILETLSFPAHPVAVEAGGSNEED